MSRFTSVRAVMGWASLFCATPVWGQPILTTPSAVPGSPLSQPLDPFPAPPEFAELLPDLTFYRTNLDDVYRMAFPAAGASPNSLGQFLFAESPEILFLTVGASGGVRSDQTFLFQVVGLFWQITVELKFDPATTLIFDTNDILTVSGTVQHIVAPHPEDANRGPVLQYNLEINADNATPMGTPGGPLLAVVANDVFAGEHPGISHLDLGMGRLVGLVETSTPPLFDDITVWTGFVIVVHTPQPSIFCLLASGAVVLLGWGSWRRWC